MNNQSRKEIKKGIHFPLAIAVSLCLFVLCVIYLFFHLGVSSVQDKEAYHLLIDKKEDNTTFSSSQDRQGLIKEIFFNKENQRLRLFLKSERSELVLNQKEGSSGVVEHMQKVICYYQEELFYKIFDGREVVKQLDGRLLIRDADPAKKDSWIDHTDAITPMQQVLYLKSNQATYYYKEELFIAENVELYRYILPGHELTEKASVTNFTPLMRGNAKQVELSLAGKELKFKANHFKAKISTFEGFK